MCFKFRTNYACAQVSSGRSTDTELTGKQLHSWVGNRGVDGSIFAAICDMTLSDGPDAARNGLNSEQHPATASGGRFVRAT